jgi:hypothetical protein
MFDTGGIAGKVAQAHALLADVAASITADTSGIAAQEALVEALALAGQLDLAVVLLTERVDRTGQFASDGSASMAAWLRNEAHASHGWASLRVQIGRALADALPATRRAWERGELGLEHADVIRRAVTDLDEAQTAQLDRALAAAAPNASPKDLRSIASLLLEDMAPTEQATKRDRAEETMKCHLSDIGDGGRLDADLDAESTAIVRAALEKYMGKPVPTVNDDGTAGPPLKASHRRALALVEMCRQALDFGTDHPGASNKPHLVITISEQQLRSGLGAVQLPGGGVIPATGLRRMACDAKIIPLLLGSGSMPLDVGRESRTVTPSQRVALNERDKGCKTPGCDRPPAWCDAHHVWHWIDGGPTDLDWLVLLCRHHHTEEHKGRLSIEALGKGIFTFTVVQLKT